MNSNSVTWTLSIGLLLLSKVALGSGGAHDPIVIQNDSDFASCNCALGGDGSGSKPFVIGPWAINKVTAVAVSIDGTNLTKSLMIWNLTVGGNGADSSTGIVLRNINRGANHFFAAVEGPQTTIQAVGAGILVDSSSDVTLDGGGESERRRDGRHWRRCDQSQPDGGIDVESSSRVVVRGWLLSVNGQDGQPESTWTKSRQIADLLVPPSAAVKPVKLPEEIRSSARAVHPRQRGFSRQRV